MGLRSRIVRLLGSFWIVRWIFVPIHTTRLVNENVLFCPIEKNTRNNISRADASVLVLVD